MSLERNLSWLGLRRPLSTRKAIYHDWPGQSSQPKHISRTRERDTTPTTLHNFRASLRRCPSLSPTSLFLLTRKPVSSTIPWMLPAFALGLCNHARTSPWDSPANVSCYKSSSGDIITLQHIYSHAQNFGNECGDHAAVLGAYRLISNQIIHSLGPLFIRLHFFVCAMWQP